VVIMITIGIGRTAGTELKIEFREAR